MKKMHVVAIAAILFLAAAPVLAQDNFARVQIPFEFRAGSQVLPAGEYQLHATLGNNRLAIRQVDGAAGACLLARVGYASQTREVGLLKFHKYGKTYFLRSFEAAGREDSYVLPQSSAEREMARRAATVEAASVRTR